MAQVKDLFEKKKIITEEILQVRLFEVDLWDMLTNVEHIERVEGRFELRYRHKMKNLQGMKKNIMEVILQVRLFEAGLSDMLAILSEK